MIQYLKVTETIEIIYKSNQRGDLIIKGYLNFNWAKNYVIKKSNLGFVFILKKKSINQNLKN